MARNPLTALFSEAPLPPQVSTVTDVYAPQQYATGQAEIAGGQALQAGGQSALAMAQKGRLTAPQQAQLDVYKTDLENQALTTYRGMGIEPTKSTSFLSTQEDIDRKTLAMSQEFIRSTIALGGAELAAGSAEVGLGGQFEQAATGDLLKTAEMQVQQDQAYSKLIGDTLQAVAKMAAVAAAPGAGSFLSSLLPGSSGGGSRYEGDINTEANRSFS